jgi:hypothetical protein
MDYTTLSLADVRAGLEDVAQDTQRSFGSLDARQLNWKPEAARWSVAQCFEHLVTANRLMLRAAQEALGDTTPRTVWQRLPGLPRVWGRLLIRSQSPESARKYTASPKATPSTSEIDADIIATFIAQHRDATAAVQRLDEPRANRAIMTSPFISVVTYSVLDGWRLVLAHDRRHIEQARRVMLSQGFPR